MQHSNYNDNNQQHQHNNHNHHHNQNQPIPILSSSSSSSSSPSSSSLSSSLSTTKRVTSTIRTTAITNTAKLPIETVKLLIASVSRRPNLWIRTNNGQKRCDINALWQQVSQEVHLPADICRIKWGHLRDNFRKVFIRNTLSREPPTTWRFYNDMRFMEGAVAENIMRQHRLREQSLYWHQTEQKPTADETNFFNFQRDNTKRTIMNQFNYGDLSTFLEYAHYEPYDKRIKLEPKEDNINNNIVQNSSTLMPLMNDFPKTNPYKSTNQLDDNDNDDDFDEDAISTEDNYTNISNTVNSNRTIDTSSSCNNDRIKSNDKSFSMTNNIDNERKANKLESTNFLNSELIPTNDTNEEDSDRMYLLSLLPYLRRVSEQRKLLIRQRLQNVLIEEFG